MRVKYIKTKSKEIIVFSELMNHSAFSNFEPVSAGFISIGALGKGEPDCTCYGKSITLGLESDEKEDTELARIQILGYGY
jgi:hypothetical protein